jgi:SAM-dependent methyltransferase
MTRNTSFGTSQLTIIDKLIFGFRLRRILKWSDFNGKIVVDTWTWFNALTLQNIKNNFSKVKSVIAVDMSLNKEYLKKIGINCIEQDLNQWIKLDKKGDIDFIISTAILEHLSEPEIYLKSIYNHLKVWWKLIMTVPSHLAKPILEFWAFRLWIFDKIEISDHKEYYDKKSLIDILSKSWFKKEKIIHSYFQFRMNNFIKY